MALLPVEMRPGTNPVPDSSAQNTLQFTESRLARFFQGRGRKLGGWIASADSSPFGILGAARTAYSYRSTNGGVTLDRLLIGTNRQLYSYQAGTSYNITPLLTATTAIANKLNTEYQTLGNDPLDTTSGSTTVTVTWNNCGYWLRAGDSITLSGSAAVGGIIAGDINTTHTVVSFTSISTFTIVVANAASSTATGGGAAVVIACALIGVTATAHGLVDGNRVKITLAADTGGIPAAQINKEHTIRYYTANIFYVATTTKATSSVSAAGGAATLYQKQITDGNINAAQGVGFGGGNFGSGAFGTGKQFTTTNILPRIWSMDRFGDDLILCPGGQTGVYIWQGATDTGATALTNAPTAANWVFVSDNCVVALGGGGNPNRINASDVGNATVWTPAATNLAYEDDVEGVGTFISQAKSKKYNLLYTEKEVLLFYWVGAPNKWELEDLLLSDGLIAPKARAEVQDAVFWMGNGDFYMFDGASVSSIPNNTVKEFIFGNINLAQKWKIFCGINPVFGEVTWFYPSLNSNEPDSYVIYNYKEGHWTHGVTGCLSRTAFEEPTLINAGMPYIINATSATVAGTIYLHESGYDDNGSAMDSYLLGNYYGNEELTFTLDEIWPDTVQIGNVDLTINTKLYAQDPNVRTFGPFAITPTTGMIAPRAHGRLMQFKYESNALGEDYILQAWKQKITPDAPL